LAFEVALEVPFVSTAVAAALPPLVALVVAVEAALPTESASEYATLFAPFAVA
jgi:hypothetical protein